MDVLKFSWILPFLSLLNFVFFVKGIIEVINRNPFGFVMIILNGFAMVYSMYVFFKIRRWNQK